MEKDVSPRAPVEHIDGDSDGESKREFKSRSEKEIESGYGGSDFGMGQVPTDVELPPYQS